MGEIVKVGWDIANDKFADGRRLVTGTPIPSHLHKRLQYRLVSVALLPVLSNALRR